jgi:geranylgeranyl diphosphate synthase type II
MIKQLQQQVEKAIADINWVQEPTGLYQPIDYVLALGGKRIRPVLTLLACKLFSDDEKQALSTALAVEVFHNFTLLHDDVMDRAEVRRGKPCVHKVWDDNTAILSGDSMLVLAYQRVAQCSPSLLPQVIELFTQTALEIGEGQQFDLDFESRTDVTESEYIEMIRLKTSVLLACSLKLGAILAGASDSDADALYQFGEKIGLAFQLQDDYLDVYGDYRTFGKKIGGDILCNKKTFMLINALQKANPTQRTELMQWLQEGNSRPEEKIKEVTRLYTEIGVDSMAIDRINAYYQEA